MNTYSISPIPAFSDNYIWLIEPSIKTGPNELGACAVVDPGDARAVSEHLQQKRLTLAYILVTHHHPDHTGGIADLKRQFPQCEVIAHSQSKYRQFDRAVDPGDQIELMGIQFEIIGVPGHTLDHIAYFAGHQSALDDASLFCGDTLFSGGCGRLFEGDPSQMNHSMEKLRALPGSTKVFCAHEYTLTNLNFAQAVEPNNQALKDYARHCESLREHNTPTIPTTIDTELSINPFMRVTSPEVVSFAKSLSQFTERELEADEVFKLIREAKDRF